MLVMIGETLPLAIAIAFSPLAIVAVVVLLSSHPRASSIGFLLWWAVGVLAVAGYLLAGLVAEPSDGPRLVAPLALAALGAVSIALAVQQWLAPRARRRGRATGLDRPHRRPLGRAINTLRHRACSVQAQEHAAGLRRGRCRGGRWSGRRDSVVRGGRSGGRGPQWVRARLAAFEERSESIHGTCGVIRRARSARTRRPRAARRGRRLRRGSPPGARASSRRERARGRAA